MKFQILTELMVKQKELLGGRGILVPGTLVEKDVKSLEVIVNAISHQPIFETCHQVRTESYPLKYHNVHLYIQPGHNHYVVPTACKINTTELTIIWCEN